jgi:sugar lactone lactonase YvrE
MPADAASEIASDQLNVLPHFALELADEIKLAGEPVAAESLILRKDDIEVHTRTGIVNFSMTGERGGSSGSFPAMGADGFLLSNGVFVYGLVIEQSLVWFGWEISGTVLENIQSATGLGVGRNPDLCEGCVYVTDGPAQAVKEYGQAGTFSRELPLPDTDPQGVAVADSGKVYVADAKYRRLLRVSSRLEKVEAVADFPSTAGGSVPTGLSFDDMGRLFVCFRDRNSLLILNLPVGP